MSVLLVNTRLWVMNHPKIAVDLLIELRKWDLYSLRAHGQRLFEMTAEPFFRNG